MDSEEKTSVKQELDVFVPPDIRKGVYANNVQITTAGSGEVYMDFVFAHPQETEGKRQKGILVSRVTMTIGLAKSIQMILNAQLGKPKNE